MSKDLSQGISASGISKSGASGSKQEQYKGK
jgi:hypothetical protein